MKYEPPYGSPGSNDPYINGNPATGTMGSIPPAASIENPQREIVNFETDSGLTPTDTDLHQLSKSVQNGLVNYCQDAGTPNFIAVTPTPAIAAYAVGQHFRIKVANPNTGPTQINVSNVGWAPVVHPDKTPMAAYELFTGTLIDVAFDGTSWQMMTGGPSGGVIFMTAPRSLYVNATTGSDTTLDGTQATIDVTNTHGPFKTLRHALGQTSKYNLSGFTFHVYLADGTYADPAIIPCPIPNGSGSIFVHGNSSVPQNVKIINTGSGSTLQITGGFYQFDGVSIQNTATNPGDGAAGIWAAAGAAGIWLYAVDFFNCAGAHILAGPGGGSVSISGPIGIFGSAQAHMAATQNGTITFWPNPYPSLTVYNSVNFSVAFVSVSGGGQVSAFYTAINGGGFVSGPKYVATGNGVVSTSGSGASYLPGSIAGSTASGGQYV